MKRIITSLLCLTAFFGTSQDQLDVIDAQLYHMYIEVNDTTNSIEVKELFVVKMLNNNTEFYLDLISKSGEFGMTVTHVMNDSGDNLKYSHIDNKLWIDLGELAEDENGEQSFFVRYKGVPETGLIIGKNKFGQRTFFGDNWPNRARNWIACIDHPSDKATINFNVIAPKKYDCIATGTLEEKTKLDNDRNLFAYRSSTLLPTKVMVIGLAEFDIKKIKNKMDIDLSIWAYEESAKEGFKDMAVAQEVLEFFIDKVAEYPYIKLANVQSTTQFGGMENAGNIFYDENAVTGKLTMEALVAHEIAHQWFGNSASESDWQHLWLSEGFATYFTDLYWENKYGTDAMNERLIGERNRVLAFSKKYNHPVVDTSYTSLMSLLNPHSYQKGAWFLHMLRNEIGENHFWNGVVAYYDKYAYSNASTEDFKKVIEETCGLNLDVFFNQWLYETQHPTLKILYNENEGGQVLSIHQLQHTHLYDFNLEIEFAYDDGTKELRTFRINNKKSVFPLTGDKMVTGMKYDPNVKLLFEQVEN